jgi:hypothetical protein
VLGELPPDVDAEVRGVSKLLDEEEAYLWPETMSAARATQVSRSELIELYPYRSALPSGLWRELFNGAEAQIDVLVYAAVFLHEQHPDLNDVLRSKVAAGCKVRVALGDPDSEPVRARGAEERFGHGIESRRRLALMHYRPLLGLPGIEVKVYQTTLYNSIYRFDDEMLVNAHVWGVNAYSAPLMHLRRLGGGLLIPTPPASRPYGKPPSLSLEKAWPEPSGADRLLQRPAGPGPELGGTGGERHGGE